MRILIIEDDKKQCYLLQFQLEQEGYAVDVCFDGADADYYLSQNAYDIVLLDRMLPNKDGITILQEMRAKQNMTPVILLTALGELSDKITGLDSGADDYLVKPFGIMEMVSRVKAVLRRCRREPETKLLQIGGLVLNPSEHMVTVDGNRVELTFKEYELLRTFLFQPNVAFTREQLLAGIWKSDYLGETRTVDMHIRTLRQKLGSYGTLIETVRNVGYRLGAKHDK